MAQLLGRAEELSALSAHLGLTRARPPGGGQAVLLAGDAGMGKTRLLTELADRARAEGWRVMLGHCLDFADLLLPYLPFSELVGRLADEDEETAREVARLHPAITALAPGRRLMSGGSPPGRWTGPVSSTGCTGRWRRSPRSGRCSSWWRTCTGRTSPPGTS